MTLGEQRIFRLHRTGVEGIGPIADVSRTR